MKLLCLNLWGARQGEVLLSYLKQQAAETDIFCFQEVFDSNSEVKIFDGARLHLFEELQELLTDHIGYFAKVYDGWIDRKKVDFDVSQCQAIFVKKGIELLETGDVYIFGDAKTEIASDFINEPKNLQYARLNINGRDLLITNVHGLWYSGEKLDSPDRIEQSRKILDFLSKYSCAKIVCGDFNLMPQTQSIKMLEQGMENLIKVYKIKSTRNKISWKHNKNIQYFADFMFTSPEIKVNDFEVPYNEVSDHLPMLLDFNL